MVFKKSRTAVQLGCVRLANRQCDDVITLWSHLQSTATSNKHLSISILLPHNFELIVRNQPDTQICHLLVRIWVAWILRDLIFPLIQICQQEHF